MLNFAYLGKIIDILLDLRSDNAYLSHIITDQIQQAMARYLLQIDYPQNRKDGLYNIRHGMIHIEGQPKPNRRIYGRTPKGYASTKPVLEQLEIVGELKGMPLISESCAMRLIDKYLTDPYKIWVDNDNAKSIKSNPLISAEYYHYEKQQQAGRIELSW